ncbi:hypothetical protein ACFFLZ_00810 [Photobacterium aphoticum]|uniref:Uncharacterized protein n=1 Tax=Photobacterium aphoticum TaxID=754436 RepID=A0A0J1GJE1_9GAMM|nr:hypothetical protein [Photobacterium aphoticum]KLU99799.1 hypothetical protein ABT58_15095 [Photobacterium aphoticum]PSU59515.1 hypothetical protein C9I90_03305 [Photobacterium aphoticum]GHA40105.1 hypothetical protein GCM10007086_11970 [Photobacterium aphoticum]
MKVGLKLDAQHVIIKHNISAVISHEDALQLKLNNDDCYLVFCKQDNQPDYYDDESTAMEIYLPVNEFHRVERELSEYLGIDIHFTTPLEA